MMMCAPYLPMATVPRTGYQTAMGYPPFPNVQGDTAYPKEPSRPASSLPLPYPHSVYTVESKGVSLSNSGYSRDTLGPHRETDPRGEEAEGRPLPRQAAQTCLDEEDQLHLQEACRGPEDTSEGEVHIEGGGVHVEAQRGQAPGGDRNPGDEGRVQGSPHDGYSGDREEWERNERTAGREEEGGEEDLQHHAVGLWRTKRATAGLDRTAALRQG